MLILLILWPIIEIALFIIVGQKIGVGDTILLILLAIFIGVILLKIQGFDVIRRAQEQVNANEYPHLEIFEGLCVLMAAGLLIAPGFLSDVIGIILFIKPIRGWLYKLLRQLPRENMRFDIKTFYSEKREENGMTQRKTIETDYKRLD